MKKNLKDKVVVITGGAGGLGLALALEAAARGARLSLLDIHPQALENARNHLKNIDTAVIVSTHTIDISQQDLWDEVVRDIVATYGSLDILVNNAGITLTPQPLERIDARLYDKVVSVNLLGAIYAVRACLPHILRSTAGGVINISSLAGQLGLYGYNPYSVSKFGLRGMGEGLQMEFAGTAHRCLNVFPGGIKTGIMKNAPDLSEQMRETAHRDFMNQATVEPHQAARTIWSAYQRRKLSLIMGFDARLILLMSKVLGKKGLSVLKAIFDFQSKAIAK